MCLCSTKCAVTAATSAHTHLQYREQLRMAAKVQCKVFKNKISLFTHFLKSTLLELQGHKFAFSGHPFPSSRLLVPKYTRSAIHQAVVIKLIATIRSL